MDDNIQTVLLLLLSALLVLLNGFFVAAEFALVKVRMTRIQELVDDGNQSARYVMRAIRHLDAYLSATQLGITLTSLGLGWIGEPVISHRVLMPLFKALGIANYEFIPLTSVIIGFLIITFAHIIYGELAPKSLAIQRAESIAMFVARPMALFHWLFRPFIWALNGLANASVRLFGVQPARDTELSHSEEELRMLIAASGKDGGTLRETQAELLDNVFSFGHRLGRQIMIHRTEVQALDVENTLEENIRLAQEGGHTRYPLIQEDLDTVLGFVHTKDLFALYQRDHQGDIRSIMREVLVMPESIRVDMLLRQLQRNRQHMAVLVDEYGGTAGLVTVADLLEELVGELPDEFEPREEAWINTVDENTWSVDGRLPLADLEEFLGHDLPCEEACDTVGGYAFWAFGRIPMVGDVTEKENVTLKVLAMDGRRVSRVEITAEWIPDEDEGEEEGLALRGGR